MIQFGNFTNQQTKWRVTKFALIIFFAPEFACQHSFQLLIITRSQRNVMGQLVNSQRISVLIDIAVYFGTVVFKVVRYIQLNSFLAIYNWISKFGNNTFLPSVLFVQKMNQTTKLFPNLFKQQNIIGIPKVVCMDFL